MLSQQSSFKNSISQERLLKQSESRSSSPSAKKRSSLTTSPLFNTRYYKGHETETKEEEMSFNDIYPLCADRASINSSLFSGERLSISSLKTSTERTSSVSMQPLSGKRNSNLFPQVVRSDRSILVRSSLRTPVSLDSEPNEEASGDRAPLLPVNIPRSSNESQKLRLFKRPAHSWKLAMGKMSKILSSLKINRTSDEGVIVISTSFIEQKTCEDMVKSVKKGELAGPPQTHPWWTGYVQFSAFTNGMIVFYTCMTITQVIIFYLNSENHSRCNVITDGSYSFSVMPGACIGLVFGYFVNKRSYPIMVNLVDHYFIKDHKNSVCDKNRDTIETIPEQIAHNPQNNTDHPLTQNSTYPETLCLAV